MRRICTWCACIILTLAGSAGASQGTAKPAASQAAAGPVNVNAATQADLEALPGVGPATAKKIIAGRPYTSAADLTKAGVSKATVDKIATMITFGAASSMSMPMPKPAAPASMPSPASSSGAAARTSAPAASTVTAQLPPVKGMVWVNLETKVFHREGDRYYGKTKKGKFMSEADAVQAGYREAKVGAVKTPAKP